MRNAFARALRAAPRRRTGCRAREEVPFNPLPALNCDGATPMTTAATGAAGMGEAGTGEAGTLAAGSGG
jgi:hypothetical protein